MKRYESDYNGDPMETKDGQYYLCEDVDKEIGSLEKRVKELEWQPIDTAPRDGTPVDLWHKNGFTVNETWWTDDECWSCVMDDDQFTHWKKVIPPQV